MKMASSQEPAVKKKSTWNTCTEVLAQDTWNSKKIHIWHIYNSHICGKRHHCKMLLRGWPWLFCFHARDGFQLAQGAFFFLPSSCPEITQKYSEECRKNQAVLSAVARTKSSKSKYISVFCQSALWKKQCGIWRHLGFVNSPQAANGLAISWPERFEVCLVTSEAHKGERWSWRLLKPSKLRCLPVSQGHSLSQCQNVSNNQTYLTYPNLRLLHILAWQSSSSIIGYPGTTLPTSRRWPMASRNRAMTEPHKKHNHSEPIQSISSTRKS